MSRKRRERKRKREREREREKKTQKQEQDLTDHSGSMCCGTQKLLKTYLTKAGSGANLLYSSAGPAFMLCVMPGTPAGVRGLGKSNRDSSAEAGVDHKGVALHSTASPPEE
ncbi:unnamed protein product [Polarella glacialis]|uniref:Uncharacterized protein n=1 Tax=Polarella glacialis TaxID=89957 RepID=A0A813IK85_POLGL|nr:unnamed protein product [Polarella glacialis]